MTTHPFDPLRDPRYDALVAGHRASSIFHTTGWLRALRRTYGYRPLGWTTARDDEAMRCALVACEVSSWLTGRRLVSIPFADHAQPLATSPEERQVLIAALHEESRRRECRYAEIRWSRQHEEASPLERWSDRAEFAFHQLDISPDEETLLASFHKTAIRQPIRRAQREQLVEQCGRDDHMLDRFYALLLLTRRKHGLPPQPRRWFVNLSRELGSAMQIRVASKEGQPVAAIITCRHRDTLHYKYGASDPAAGRLGGTPFLLWNAIREGRSSGLHTLDLGRSDLENEGLIRFKDRWGAQRSELRYQRTAASPARFSRPGWPLRVAHNVCGHLPDALLEAAGGMLYRHMG